MMSDGVARANKRPKSANRLISFGKWVWRRTDTMVCRYSSDNFKMEMNRNYNTPSVSRQKLQFTQTFTVCMWQTLHI